MFDKLVLTTFLVLLSSLVAQAKVNPTEPGPGDVFRAGQICHVSWTGDKDSKTAWTDMGIELMTGSNNNMVHLTTIANELEGSITGNFEFTCPEVNPYSAIYFYQFSSTHNTAKAWTTRFTIASPSGAVVPPTNKTQPGSNKKIPWGTGSLDSPSNVEAPPEVGSDSKFAAEASEEAGYSTSSPVSNALSTTEPFNSTRSTSATSITTAMSNSTTVIVTETSRAPSIIPISDATANFAPVATAGGVSVLHNYGANLWIGFAIVALVSSMG